MKMKSSTKSLAIRATAFGVGGWVVENTLFGPKNSKLFDGIKVPVLPGYAAGGLAVQALAKSPSIRNLSWWQRAAVYGATLSAVELAGCFIDREVIGACSWDYSKGGCKSPLRGCMDLKHVAVWAALGLLVEKAL